MRQLETIQGKTDREKRWIYAMPPERRLCIQPSNRTQEATIHTQAASPPTSLQTLASPMPRDESVLGTTRDGCRLSSVSVSVSVCARDTAGGGSSYTQGCWRLWFISGWPKNHARLDLRNNEAWVDKRQAPLSKLIQCAIATKESM